MKKEIPTVEILRPALIAHIIGELILKEKYKFIDGKLISEIVTDTLNTLRDFSS
jgi:hypothetical protein